MDHSKYNPDRFKRKSIRLPGRNYAAKSAYFITIRSDQHQTLFEIPELREILQETWNDLPKRFPSISLDEFVIMPDHIHFILWLDFAQQNTPTLGSVVGAYKSIAAVAWIRHIETNNLIQYPGRIWQRGYYEHVVRIAELEQTRLYIRNNPTKRKDTGQTNPNEM
jgi:REP-associated tyrosine transposase